MSNVTETPRIVVSETLDAVALRRLEEVGTVTILDRYDELSLAHAVTDADALLVRSYAKVTQVVMESATRLRVIGRAGVGLENIDVAAAAAKGISVVYTPGAATDAVADLTIGFIISLLRGVHRADESVRQGRFREARDLPMASEMSELTIGIVGMGRIGQAVGRRCAMGFGMTVIFHDIIAPGPLSFPARLVTKDEVYSTADVVSLHVPLTESTRYMIDRQTLAMMKTTALLINTARGAVIDGVAVAESLFAGRLGGAAMDVFDPEPLPPDHPLHTAPRTLFTPHIGAKTASGQRRMNDVVDDVIRVLRGESPQFAAGPVHSSGCIPGAP